MTSEPATATPVLIAGATTYADVVIDSFEAVPGIKITAVLSNQELPPEEQPGLRPVLQDDGTPDILRQGRIVCALGTTKRRKWLSGLAERGADFTTLVHPACTVSSRSTLGGGCLVDAGTIIAGFADIQPHVRIGRGVRIGHHTTIGSFSTIHPGCVISGHVHIGEQVTIGTGAVLIDRVRIGEGAVIAAGSVVTKNVPAFSIVRGNPARVLRRSYGPV